MKKLIITVLMAILFSILGGLTFMNTAEVEAGTTTLNPTKDFFLDNGGSYNNDTSSVAGHSTLWAGCNASLGVSYERAAMQFGLSSISGSITNATLRIYISHKNGTPIVNLYGSISDNWNEPDATIPSQDHTLINGDSNITQGQWKEFDVTSFISSEASGDDLATFVLTGYENGTDNNFAFDSREDLNYPPQLVVTTDSTPPTVTLTDNDANDIVKQNDAVTITATFSEPMTNSPTISIANGGVSGAAMTNSGDSVTWTYNWTVPAGNAIATVTVAGTDLSGNAYAGTDTLTFTIDNTAPNAPTVSSITQDLGASGFDGITKDQTLTINGTAEANSTVEVFRDGVSIGTTTANGSGNWSFDYTGNILLEGTYVFTAVATDAAGNTGAVSAGFTVVIDITAPAAPVITSLADDTGASSTDKITNDNTLVFSGTAEANSYVELFNAHTYDSWGIAQTNGEGSWSFDYSGTSLSNGTHYVVAVARDIAGNQSGVSSTFTFTVDRTAPTVTLTDNEADNITKQNDTVTITATFSEAMASAPTITITNGGVAGATMTMGANNTIWTYDWTIPAGNAAATVTVAGNDIAGNSYAGANTLNFTIDNTAPTVSITDNETDNIVKQNDTVTITTTFSEPMTNTPTITITYGGVSGAAMTDSGDSVTWTYNWTVPAGDATATVTVAGTDLAGNAYVGSDTLTFAIDNTGPTVTSVNVPANATYVAGQNLAFTVNFDEVVSVSTAGGTPRIPITLDTGGTVYASYLSGSGTSALVFRYIVQAGQQDTDGVTLGAAVDLNGGTLKDSAGNDAALTLNNVGSTAAVLVDGVTPNVTSVGVPANATYIAGQNLDFTVNFDEVVSVNTAGGTPRISLTLDTGGTVYADYVSGSGTSALVFRYVVQAGQQDTNGVAVGATVSLNGGTLKDSAGNDAALTLNNVGSTAAVLVDGVAPNITSVGVPANATYIAGQNLDFTVNFDEVVSVNTAGGTPRIPLTLDTGTVYADYVSGSGTSALVFRYVVQAGQQDSNGVAVGATVSLNGGTLKDSAGNDAALTLNNVGSTAGVLVDGVAPNVTSVGVPANAIYVAGQNLNFTVNFSEAVTVNTGGGTPRIPITLDTGTVYADYVSGSGTTALVFSYSVQAGQQDSNGVAVGAAVDFNGGTLRDAAGNDATLTFNGIGSTTGVLVDAVAPTVINLYPVDNAIGVGVNDNLVITFDENVVVGTGNITIKKSLDNSVVEIIDVTGAKVTGGGTDTIIINPDSTFETGTGYYVEIASTAFSDVAGSSFAGIVGATTWNFTAVTSSNADLSGLSLSSGTLSPVFASGTTSYTASVSNATTSITVTPTVADATATVTVNGSAVASGNASGAISLSVGDNIITVVVTAQDGTVKTYTVTVTRLSNNANLSNLTLSSGTLSPEFASGTTSYTTTVANGVASITVTPTVADATATVTVNGSAVTSGNASGAINLSVGDNPITVVVTAQDGTQKTYTVTVTRAVSSNAHLSDLTLSDGTISPAFASGTTSYTLSVANSVYQTTVTASVFEANATLKINGVDTISGQPSGFIGLDVGSNTVAVTVYAQDGVTTKTYEITITRAALSSGSSSSSSDDDSNDEGSIDNVSDTEITNDGDKTVITVTVNETKLEEQLNRVGNNAKVIIPANGSSDVVVGELTGTSIKKMEDKDAVLEIKTDRVTYNIPASQINIDDVSAKLGEQVQLKDIKVQVKITEPEEATVRVVEDTAIRGNYQLVTKPVEFDIQCSSGDKTVEVSKFNTYVERTIAVPEGIDPSKITTGVVINSDGTFSHVPTTIVNIGGKYYAKINSLTNSTYATIWNPKEFTDVDNHWSKEAVNDMGSRLVISGYGDASYQPGKEITRAEFAAIVVNALGLRETSGKIKFSDVNENSWYYEKVGLAYEYGIVNGYNDGTFKPGKKITREEAMAMIAKAMEIAKLDINVKTEEVTEVLGKFSDTGQISGWAGNLSAACVKNGVVAGYDGKLAPKDNITRAETAVMVINVLKKAELI